MPNKASRSREWFWRRGVAGFVATILVSVWALPVARASFADVPASHPQAAAINSLASSGIIAGYPDGTFRPEQTVNRAETLKILLLGSGITPAASGSSFPDVAPAAWFAPFVAEGKSRGIIAGYPDGTFRPEQTVNRVEALKMLLAVSGISLTNYQTNAQLFADTTAAAWYNPQLNYAQLFNLFDFASGQAQPAAALTRGQLAEAVYRFQNRAARTCPALTAKTGSVATTAFTGLTLARALPRLFAENEVLTVSGTAATATAVTLFYENAWNEQTAVNVPVVAGQFRAQLPLAAVGELKIALLPGSSGTTRAAGVTVLPRECQPATAVGTATLPSAATFQITSENKPEISWQAAADTLTRVTLSQTGRQAEFLLASGEGRLTLDPVRFADFQPGVATVQLAAARATGGSSTAARTAWTAAPAQTVQLTLHAFSTLNAAVSVDTALPLFHGSTLTLTGDLAQLQTAPNAYLTTPTGRVTELPLTRSGSRFGLSAALPEAGTYFLEINDTAGLAVLNVPLYPPNTWPLLPDFFDLRRPTDRLPPGSWHLTNEVATWLELINAARAAQNVPAVRLDTQLATLAQNYADQMARENFFAHTDPAGGTPDTRRRAAGFPLPVGENLALDSTLPNAHAGLLRSGSHRQNLQNAAWGRVGLGVAQSAHGELIFVQEFAADTLSTANISQLKTELFTQLNALRATPLAADTQLAEAAQDWADYMATADFLGFTAPGGETLESFMRATGFTGRFRAFVGVAGSLTELVNLVAERQALEAGSTFLVLGLAQDGDGQLRLLLLQR